MHNLRSVGRWAVLGLALGMAASLSGCGDGSGGGGSKPRFVPNDNNIEQINGMSPSQAFHKSDRRR